MIWDLVVLRKMGGKFEDAHKSTQKRTKAHKRQLDQLNKHTGENFNQVSSNWSNEILLPFSKQESAGR